MKESKYGFICHKSNTKCLACRLCHVAIKFNYVLSKKTDENGFAIFYYKGDKTKAITCNDFLKKAYHAEVMLQKDYQKWWSYKKSKNAIIEGIYCHNTKGDYKCCEDCDAFDYALCLGYKPHGNSTDQFKQFIGPHGDIKSCKELMQKGCGLKIVKIKTETKYVDIDLVKEQVKTVSDQMMRDCDKIQEKELKKYQQQMNQLAYEKWLKEREVEKAKKKTLLLEEKDAKQREKIQDKIDNYYKTISKLIYNPEYHELYRTIYDAPVCCGDCSECDIVPIYQARGICYKKSKSYYNTCHQFALGSQNEIMNLFGLKYLGEVLDLESENHDGIAPFLENFQILQAMKDSHPELGTNASHPELCPNIINEEKGV